MRSDIKVMICDPSTWPTPVYAIKSVYAVTSVYGVYSVLFVICKSKLHRCTFVCFVLSLVRNVLFVFLIIVCKDLDYFYNSKASSSSSFCINTHVEFHFVKEHRQLKCVRIHLTSGQLASKQVQTVYCL